MTTDVNERVREFAVRLLERNGALVEGVGAGESLAILPPGVARALRVPEEVRITASAGAAADGRGWSANLATDFLERVESLVATCPTAAGVRLENLYLKKSAMDEPVARYFSFPTARARVAGTRAVRLEYHCWHFLAAIDSEDRWEELVGVQMNGASGARVELPDPLGMMEALPAARPFEAGAPDLAGARQRASLIAAARASAFLGRLEARLERDRRRIREYYGALLGEASPAHGRMGGDAAKLEEKRRAVEVEMRRRLLELDDRYALRLRLDPVALVALEMPVLEVELEISQRPAAGLLRVYWNPLRKELEPLACGRCGANITSIRFDAKFRPLCGACEGKK